MKLGAIDINELFLKNKRLEIRISEDLYKDLKKTADYYKMTVSSFARYILVSAIEQSRERGIGE